MDIREKPLICAHTNGLEVALTRPKTVERPVVNDEAVGYHLRKLAREGRPARDRKGRARVYYPVQKQGQWV